MSARKTTPALATPSCDELQQNATTGPDLSPIQLQALAALAAGATMTAAAESSGVNRTTLHRWLTSDADFVAALNRAKGEVVAALEAELRELGSLAVRAMRDLIVSTDTPPAVRLRACMAALAVAEGVKMDVGWQDPEVVRSSWRAAERLAESSRLLF